MQLLIADAILEEMMSGHCSQRVKVLTQNKISHKRTGLLDHKYNLKTNILSYIKKLSL